jgi:hypothetical protein
MKHGNPDPDYKTRMRVALNCAGSAGDSAYPSDDAKDQANGARFIPGEVTLARRVGQPVNFVQACPNSVCWYWEFHDANANRRIRSRFDGPSYYGHPRLDYGMDEYGDPYGSSGSNRYKPGQRIYHFDRYLFETLRDQHDGKCPLCGNTHISGATGVPLELA